MRPNNRSRTWRIAALAAVTAAAIAACVIALQPSGGERKDALKRGSSASEENVRLAPAPEAMPTSSLEADSTPSPSPSAESADAPVYESLAVRAVGLSAFGRLELRPESGVERILPLGAPSCIGLETDLSVTGDYGVYFVPAAGKEQRMDVWTGLEIISKENAALEMRKFDFPDAELFLLIPRYADCHGLEFRAYGVEKDSGQASAYTFRFGDRDVVEWTTSPVVAPASEKGELVVEGGRAAGQDGAERYRFKPDPDRHRLVLASQEHIP
ncbi:hypothetical protein [Cohnella caldifontis]|uniref:hypothetical protein n=1 Tax=Cohnella caldifontis TaxID=3027471 RepID=UPI0023EC3A8F|nr:hypothetical protein [Cohnella sp. YIM B05605]